MPLRQSLTPPVLQSLTPLRQLLILSRWSRSPEVTGALSEDSSRVIKQCDEEDELD